MRIAYVARHDQPNSNDDEGAVTHALTQLGHDVQRLSEPKGRMAHRLKPDLVLFHKWLDLEALRSLREKRIKTAFWYFDLVEWPDDATVRARCDARRWWMQQVMPLVDVGFCTDGDWVAKHPEKLVWLPQGADERTLRMPTPGDKSIPILLVGTRASSRGRSEFVAWAKETWGDQLKHVERGVYGDALAELVSQARVVVAPDSPVTDRYWSNRIYNMLGLGAFLIHPQSDGVARQYGLDNVCLYTDREHLKLLVERHLTDPDNAHRMATAGYVWTIQGHLYRHRCEALIGEVRRRAF